MEKLEQAPQQPTAASAHPPSSHAERESKPSPESTEQKMEKLGQASSKNASASTRSQEDDCMNENGKNAKTPKDPHQVRFHNRIEKLYINLYNACMARACNFSAPAIIYSSHSSFFALCISIRSLFFTNTLQTAEQQEQLLQQSSDAATDGCIGSSAVF